MSEEVVAKFFRTAGDGEIEEAVNCFTDDTQWITPEGTIYSKDEIGDVIINMNKMREELIATTGADAHFGTPVPYGENQSLVEWSVRAVDGTVLDRGVDLILVRDGKIAYKDVFRKA
jgi:ketosteroid isomerase-like protein